MAGWSRLKSAILEKPYLLTLGLAGILVSVAGLALIGFSLPQNGQPQIQIIEPEAQNTKIYVDVGGAVVNPGVYELTPQARVNEALLAAGGIGAEADQDWVSHNLNLAQKLADGEKIYVPYREETNKVGPSQGKGPAFSGKININTASLSELDTLWGIGPVTGQKIIDNRPYAKVEDLLGKKIVKQNVFEAIKDKISVL